MGDNLDDALETFVASDELEKEIEQEVRSAEPALEQGSEENEVAAEQTPSATDADDAFIAEHLNSLQSADDATTSSEGSTPHDAPNESEGAFLEGAPAGDFAELAPKKHTARTILLILLTLIILAIAGLCAGVYYVEKQAEGIVPAGVTFAQGTSLAGKNESEVRSIIEQDAKAILASNVVASSSGEATDTIEANSVSKPANSFVTIDTETMVKNALDVRQNASLLDRFKVDVLSETIDKNIAYEYKIDEESITKFADEVAGAYDQKAKNATLKQKSGSIIIAEGQNGFETDKEALTAALQSSLEDEFRMGAQTGDISVEITGKTTTPKKTAESLQSTPAIVVTLSKRTVALYNGEKHIKTYRCAIGTPDHPTPVGNWKIVLKRKNPTWVNPGSAWATTMPKTIAPGPSNPLGLRALNLNASGIRLHGTTSLSSIGTAASHGCMRMRNQDIVDLFDRVKVGTPVFIIP